MKHRLLLLTAAFLCGISFANAQDYEDVYYNPKKAKKETVNKVSSKSAAERSYIVNSDGTVTYIDNHANIPASNYQEERDVDEYNRFGQTYYTSPIDTIGSGIAMSEDFSNTQKIQKYYNPTIVVDNSDILADVLNSSYGNVNIIYANGYPTFGRWSVGIDVWNPYYGWGTPWYGGYYAYSPWYDPWYGGYWYSPWNYGWCHPWYDPWIGPGWGWGYDWAWSHGPSYHYRPNRQPTVGAGAGWSAGARPSGSLAHRPSVSTRPGFSGRPGVSGATSAHRPSAGSGYVNNSHRVNGNSGYRVDRTPISSVRPAQGTSTYRPAQGTTSTHRGSTTVNRSWNGTVDRGAVSSGSAVTTRPSTNYSRPSNSGSSYRSSGSSYRSSGSMGGSRSSGSMRGGGGGRHR